MKKHKKKIAKSQLFFIPEAAAAITSDDDLRKVIAGLSRQDIYNIFDVASQWVLVFGIIAAVVAFMAAGIMFFTSRGDAEKLSKAKSILLYAVIGTVLIIVSRAVVVTIGKFFS